MATTAAGGSVPVGGNWMVVAEGLSGAPDGVGDFEWTLRGGAGWDLIPEVLQLSAGVAAVRGGDAWTPVIDLGLVWAW